VVQDRGRNAERGLVEQHTVENALAPIFREEAGRGAKRGGDDDVGPRLVTDDHQWVVLGEVPRVAGEPSGDTSEEILGPVHVQHRIPRQEQPQQVIKGHEVVHVRVRNERMGDLQHVTGLHPSQPAEIELKRTPLPAQADEQARITEGTIHEAWEQGGLQEALPSSSGLKIHRSRRGVNSTCPASPELRWGVSRATTVEALPQEACGTAR
jgi:hypothetical protein